jgi:hypothetical protein
MIDDIGTKADVDDLQPTDTRPTTTAVGESIADRVRRRHLAAARTKDLAVPRFEGDVVVRFKVLPTRELLRVTRGKKTPLAANADLLVAACEEVFFVDDTDGTLRPVRLEDNGPGPVRFDGRLADIVGLTGDTPRDFVIRLYAEDTALHGHAQALMAWMTGKDLDEVAVEEVDDLAGEAEAAT